MLINKIKLFCFVFLILIFSFFSMACSFQFIPPGGINDDLVKTVAFIVDSTEVLSKEVVDNTVELPTTEELGGVIISNWFTDYEFENLFDEKRVDDITRVYGKLESDTNPPNPDEENEDKLEVTIIISEYSENPQSFILEFKTKDEELTLNEILDRFSINSQGNGFYILNWYFNDELISLDYNFTYEVLSDLERIEFRSFKELVISNVILHSNYGHISADFQLELNWGDDLYEKIILEDLKNYIIDAPQSTHRLSHWVITIGEDSYALDNQLSLKEYELLMPQEDILLEAIWVKNSEYVINLIFGEGVFSDDEAIQNYQIILLDTVNLLDIINEKIIELRINKPGYLLDITWLLNSEELTNETPITQYNINLVARWNQRREFSITFLEMNEEVIKTEHVKFLDEIAFPLTSLEGHEFLGWKELGQDIFFNENLMPARDLILIAVYKRLEFEVTIDLNEGQMVNGQNVLEAVLTVESLIFKLPFETNLVEYFSKLVPTSKSHVFANWIGLTTSLAADTQITANWGSLRTFTIVIDLNNSEVINASYTQLVFENVAFGSNVLTAVLGHGIVSDSHPFMGFVDTPETLTKDLELIVLWGEIFKFEVEFMVDGVKIGVRSFEFGETITLLDISDLKGGRSFLGWSLDDDSIFIEEGQNLPMPSRNITLIAVWANDYFKLSFVTEFERTAINFEGDLVLEKHEGSAIDSVWVAVGTNILEFISSNGITTSYENGGFRLGSNDAGAQAWLYEEWKPNSDGIQQQYLTTASVMPSEDFTIYSNWTRRNNQTGAARITVDTNGGTLSNSGSLTSQVMWYYYNLLHLIHRATANTRTITRQGFDFVGWYVVEMDIIVSDYENKDFRMPGTNITIVAQWQENLGPYTIEFNSNGGSEVAPLELLYGAQIILPKNPTKEEYIFSGWLIEGEIFDYTHMPARDIVLTASWISAYVTVSIEVDGDVSDWTPEIEVRREIAFTELQEIIMGNANGYIIFDDQTHIIFEVVLVTAQGVEDGLIIQAITIRVYVKRVNVRVTFNTGMHFVETLPSEIFIAVNTQTLLLARLKEEELDDLGKVGDFVFKHWILDDEIVNETTTVPDDKNITLYAIFEEQLTNPGVVIDMTENGNEINNAAGRLNTADVIIHGKLIRQAFFAEGATSQFMSITLEKRSHVVLYVGRAAFTNQATGQNQIAIWSGMTPSDVFAMSSSDRVLARTGTLDTRANIDQLIGGLGSANPIAGESGIARVVFELSEGTHTIGSTSDTAAQNRRILMAMVFDYDENFVIDSHTVAGDLATGSNIEGWSPSNWRLHQAPRLPQRSNLNTVITFAAQNLAEGFNGVNYLYGDDLDDFVFDDTNTITFNSNGGSEVAPITQGVGSNIAAPNDPTKLGHTFAGWFTDAGLTDEFEFITMPAENITLYAKWTLNAYVITFETNGGTLGESELPTLEVEFDSLIDLPVPTKTGHTFAGWFIDEDLTEEFLLEKMPAHGFTLYAKWIEDVIQTRTIRIQTDHEEIFGEDKFLEFTISLETDIVLFLNNLRAAVNGLRNEDGLRVFEFEGKEFLEVANTELIGFTIGNSVTESVDTMFGDQQTRLDTINTLNILHSDVSLNFDEDGKITIYTIVREYNARTVPNGNTLSFDGNTMIGVSVTTTYTGNIILPTFFNGYVITHINANAFLTTTLTGIVLPNYIEEIGNRAFETWQGTMTVINLANLSYLKSIGTSVFNKAAQTPIQQIFINQLTNSKADEALMASGSFVGSNIRVEMIGSWTQAPKWWNTRASFGTAPANVIFRFDLGEGQWTFINIKSQAIALNKKCFE